MEPKWPPHPVDRAATWRPTLPSQEFTWNSIQREAKSKGLLVYAMDQQQTAAMTT